MDDNTAPSWLDRQRVLYLQSSDPAELTVRKITTLSPDALKEHYSDLIVDLSAKRRGMTLGNALDIAAGRARRTSKT